MHAGCSHACLRVCMHGRQQLRHNTKPCTAHAEPPWRGPEGVHAPRGAAGCAVNPRLKAVLLAVRLQAVVVLLWNEHCLGAWPGNGKGVWAAVGHWNACHPFHRHPAWLQSNCCGAAFIQWSKAVAAAKLCVRDTTHHLLPHPPATRHYDTQS